MAPFLFPGINQLLILCCVSGTGHIHIGAETSSHFKMGTKNYLQMASLRAVSSVINHHFIQYRITWSRAQPLLLFPCCRWMELSKSESQCRFGREVSREVQRRNPQTCPPPPDHHCVHCRSILFWVLPDLGDLEIQGKVWMIRCS